MHPGYRTAQGVRISRIGSVDELTPESFFSIGSISKSEVCRTECPVSFNGSSSGCWRWLYLYHPDRLGVIPQILVSVCKKVVIHIACSENNVLPVSKTFCHECIVVTFNYLCCCIGCQLVFALVKVALAQHVPCSSLCYSSGCFFRTRGRQVGCSVDKILLHLGVDLCFWGTDKICFRSPDDFGYQRHIAIERHQ